MKCDVLFIRSFTPDFDGKFHKYQQALSEKNTSWHFLGWDRNGKFVSKYTDKVSLYRKKGLLGGGWKNIINIILWNLFIVKYMYINRKNFTSVHIIDFDSAILAFPMAKILRKNIIFDVYDKYTSMRSFPKFLKLIIDKYERWMLENSDLAILADESRLEQHSISFQDNLLILENVPKQIELSPSILGLKQDPNQLFIGYFGVLEKDNRGLEDVVEAVLKLESWVFHVAGYGELEEFFREISEKYPAKVKFYGSQTSIDGLGIMNNMDVLLGLYYRNVPNHLYAAPNKYFEHLMLGKPLLTTIGTPPGNKVVESDTGWAIEEGVLSLHRILSCIDSRYLYEKGLNAQRIWGNHFQNYFYIKYVREYAEKRVF